MMDACLCVRDSVLIIGCGRYLGSLSGKGKGRPITCHGWHREGVEITHFRGGWMRPRDCQDRCEEEKISFPRTGIRTPNHAIRSVVGVLTMLCPCLEHVLYQNDRLVGLLQTTLVLLCVPNLLFLSSKGRGSRPVVSIWCCVAVLYKRFAGSFQ